MGAAWYSAAASRPDGRSRKCSGALEGGKSGLHENTVPDNVRRGRPQGKRHRDRTASRPKASAFLSEVRVKRCGKSAPRARQRDRHGKPHREQNRIGTMLAAQAGRGLFLGLVVWVGCSRRAAMRVPEEWPSRCGSNLAAIQNPAYRPAGTPPFATCPRGVRACNFALAAGRAGFGMTMSRQGGGKSPPRRARRLIGGRFLCKKIFGHGSPGHLVAVADSGVVTVT